MMTLHVTGPLFSLNLLQRYKKLSNCAIIAFIFQCNAANMQYVCRQMSVHLFVQQRWTRRIAMLLFPYWSCQQGLFFSDWSWQ